MKPTPKPAAPNPAIASRLQAGHHWCGVGEPEDSAAFACMKPQVTNSILAKRIGFLVVVLFMLPVLYVLSIGPAVRLFCARVLPEEFVRFWEPIRPLCDPAKPLGRALIRYQSWWLGVKYVDPPKR